jgi:hypothetical protein
MVLRFKQFCESEDKFVFHKSCDRFRLGGENEGRWREMMANKQPVTMDEFLAACDPSGILDPDETFQQYYQHIQESDPDAGLYRSAIDGVPVYFIQTAGFELIFARRGS